ncbi:hypothetical protein FACS1894179_02690 [Bacteroidia bacterium]|nr:hypothetical protein FACS1894169_02870 [Bacteroidia bacterium]GHV38774.1 hypothetical protein FACS1894179_02690 [Bacteroidia bacterium]
MYLIVIQLMKHALYKSIRNACINKLMENVLHSEIIENIMVKELSDDDSDLFYSIVRVEKLLSL